MASRVLITGGAGFIGSHVADVLITAGYDVRALDNLRPQVHGEGAVRPAYLHDDVELLRGDVCDAATVERAMEGVDAVYHFAAAVGVGRSMVRVADYVRTNDLGTAVVCEALIRRRVRRLIVASSMSVYGEGLYSDSRGRRVTNARRSVRQLQAGQWDILDDDGVPLEPVRTPESKPVSPASVCAATTFQRETLCMLLGRCYDIETVALRLSTVYGPRQGLSNPYTGVTSIFAARLMNDRPPLINEDGRQQRDLVSVHDVAKACRLALEVPEAAGQILNIASGRQVTIGRLAERLAAAMGKSHIEAVITGRYRAGDVRHRTGDITRARAVLGYEPTCTLASSLDEMAAWLSTQVADDRVEASRREVAEHGLT